ncbi:hypothetical protein DV515_00000682 [Chloebia gouldiae]|uniref:Uncharacterized protein n=1 Tax=Chloebia gouldiae TaxID=44316 RepID=A0A3L8SZ06_CHLGU|nr:hypothetical protein DV515_00000682 [Chloebia gouldiae]
MRSVSFEKLKLGYPVYKSLLAFEPVFVDLQMEKSVTQRSRQTKGQGRKLQILFKRQRKEVNSNNKKEKKEKAREESVAACVCVHDLQNGENRDSRNHMGLEMWEGFAQCDGPLQKENSQFFRYIGSIRAMEKSSLELFMRALRQGEGAGDHQVALEDAASRAGPN